MILDIKNVRSQFGDKILLDNVNLSIENHDKIGLIGVNGTGKSTFLSIVSLEKEPDSGDVTKIGDVKISYMKQDFTFEENITLKEFIDKKVKEEDVVLHELNAMLTKLEITNFDMYINNLSGGQRRKISLALALAKPCDLLILDEPTNHLDCDIIEWLEKYLIKFNKALLFVTHDRYFLEKVVNKIIELDSGKLYQYEANYSKYLELKQQREDYLQAKNRKINAFLRKEYEWIKRGPQARATKDKKRIEKYEELTSVKTKQEKKLEINSIYSRLGNKTIEFCDVSMKYDNYLFENLSFNLNKDARIGVVGKNGMGKSTFLDLISGLKKPTSGEVIIGTTIKIGYFRQENVELNNEIRVIDFINDIATNIQTKKGYISSTQMVENFLFDPYTYIGKLSGGEKRRLILLSVLMKSPNVLIFDEPTNDLDITTLSILEDYLESFEGIVIIASHDRFLLDKVVDTIYEINNNKFTMYNGNYSLYLEKSKENIKVKEKKIIKEQVKEKKQKLTYKEEKEYSVILDEIDEIETNINKLNTLINDNISDYNICKKYIDEKEELEQKLCEKMDRWEYLSNIAND